MGFEKLKFKEERGAEDEKRLQAILDAVKKGDLAKMRALLIQRAEDTNLTDENGFAPLWTAACSKHKNAGEMVRMCPDKCS